MNTDAIERLLQEEVSQKERLDRRVEVLRDLLEEYHLDGKRYAGNRSEASDGSQPQGESQPGAPQPPPYVARPKSSITQDDLWQAIKDSGPMSAIGLRERFATEDVSMESTYATVRYLIRKLKRAKMIRSVGKGRFGVIVPN